MRLGLMLADDLADLLAGAHRDGGFGGDHFVACHVSSDPLADLLDVRKIGGSIGPRWSPDCDKNHQGLIDSLADVRGKCQTIFAQSLSDELSEPRFVKRDFALLELGNPLDIRVHAGDGQTESSETG